MLVFFLKHFKLPKSRYFNLIFSHETSAKLRHILAEAEAEAEVEKWPKLAEAEAEAEASVDSCSVVLHILWYQHP